MKARAVGYIRVSSGTQLDGYGLTVQEEQVRKCARRFGFRLVRVLRDEGVPGSIEAVDRPGLAEALNLIESGSAEVLVTPRLDRLARKLTIQEAALAHVWKLGGRVFACDQGEVQQDDPDDPMRKAMRQMMGVFAELERGMIVARLRRGRAAKKKTGGYVAGRPPYGLRASDGALVKDPDEQTVIKRARILQRKGLSLREIARSLEADGHRPRRGGEWHPTQVARLVESRRRS